MVPDGTILAVPSTGVVLYRLVRHDPPTADDFGPVSRQRAEMRRLAELDRTGLSFFATAEQAAAFVWKPEQMVVSVRVPPSPRIHIARTDEAKPGHHQVWIPQDMLQSLLGSAEIPQ
jgi:hypothetical protein